MGNINVLVLAWGFASVIIWETSSGEAFAVYTCLCYMIVYYELCVLTIIESLNEFGSMAIFLFFQNG